MNITELTSACITIGGRKVHDCDGLTLARAREIAQEVANDAGRMAELHIEGEPSAQFEPEAE